MRKKICRLVIDDRWQQLVEMIISPPQKVCTHQCQSILALPDIEDTIQFRDWYPGAKKNFDGDLEVLVACVAGAVKAASLKCDQIDLQNVAIAIKPRISCCFKSVLSPIFVWLCQSLSSHALGFPLKWHWLLNMPTQKFWCFCWC